MTDLAKGFSNEISVIAKTAEEAPGAIWHDLADDWQNHRGKMVGNVAVSAGLGLGADVLLARSPMLDMALGVGFVAYGVAKALPGVSNFLGQAWNASSSSQQDAVVKSATNTLGRFGADAAESSAGFLGGGLLGGALVRYTPAENISLGFSRTVESRVRQILPESWSYRGPGTIKLGSKIMRPDGTVDLLGVADKANVPFRSVETARSLDLDTGRISRSMPGKPTSVNLIYPDAEGRVLFHTHAPGAGAEPGIPDILSTNGLGIIRSGNSTSVYSGMAPELRSNFAQTGSLEQAYAMTKPRLQTLVLDNASKSAKVIDQFVDTSRPLSNPGWMQPRETSVDYGAARQFLKNVDPRTRTQFLNGLQDLTANHSV